MRHSKTLSRRTSCTCTQIKSSLGVIKIAGRDRKGTTEFDVGQIGRFGAVDCVDVVQGSDRVSRIMNLLVPCGFGAGGQFLYSLFSDLRPKFMVAKV
jgi:hypothetical protein